MQAVGELSSFSKGLASIERALTAGMKQKQQAAAPQTDALAPLSQSLAAIERALERNIPRKEIEGAPTILSPYKPRGAAVTGKKRRLSRGSRKGTPGRRR